MSQETNPTIPSQADVAALLGTQVAPTPTPPQVAPAPPVVQPHGDIAAQRTAAAIHGGPTMGRGVSMSQLSIDTTGGEIGTPSEGTRTSLPVVPTTAVPVIAPQPLVVATPTVPVAAPGPSVPPPDPEPDPVQIMRTQMELLAQQNLSQYGLTPSIVLAGTQQTAAPAPAPVSAPAPPPPAPVAPQTFTPNFGLQVTAEEHAQAMQSPEGFAKVLTRVAEASYNQGRLALLQQDIPTLTKAVNDDTSKLIEAQIFFVKNPDLQPWAATVSLVAHQLRSTGKYKDSTSLLADVAKETRLALKLNGPAVQAAATSVVNNLPAGTVPGFAGGTGPSAQSRGSVANGKMKLQGDTIAEDFAILGSGLLT